jgi:hypothetical protein
MARRLRYVTVVALAFGAAAVPSAPARSFGSCDTAKHRYDAITARVKKASAKVDHDGSGQVAVAIFVADLKRMQKLKAAQRIAAQALRDCKH